MASRKLAKRAASRISKVVYRRNIKKPKKQVVKKFANFAGKVTFKVVRSARRFKRRLRRRMRRRMKRY